MRIAYFDESGDDGYPDFSSEFFTLSAIYLHYLNWKEVFEDIRSFRKELRTQFGLPLKVEFHAKGFLLNKRPYRSYNIADSERLNIIGLYCDLV
ncbi:MAG: DUF3800 domain-containing protein, partial [Candidatus Zixiibacteriota bacterium]